ncbi:MAG: MlaC/ttg2D family ABC transporter substrate-binding protein [Candidatus Binataceae bacterium]
MSKGVFTHLGLCGLLVILGLATAVQGAAPPQSDPLTQVKQSVTAVIAVFHEQHMPLAERREKLRVLAARYFDFADMARSALGYHWRDLTPAQRAEFVPLFTTFIQDAYLSKLQDYTVSKVQEEAKTATITFSGEKFDGAEDAEVSSSVVLHDQQDPIAIDYLMHRSDGVWRIYDLTVDAISVIANYRNQFNRVIDNDGYDSLLAQLKTKQAQLRQYLERPPHS